MTMKKIAEKVGTSAATVSRVLNNPNYKCNNPELRDKIWRAAIELDYVPNEAARNLKMGIAAIKDKTYYITVLMTRMDDAQSDPFFTELLHIVESEIHRATCILTKVWYRSVFSDSRMCQEDDLDQKIKEMYKETDGKCNGLVIIGKCEKKVLRKLVSCFKNVVSVNRNSTNYEVDEVLCDGGKIAALAVGHLIQLGHRNIGYVGLCRGDARYQGYIRTLKEYDIDVDFSNIIETGQTEAEGFEAMEKFLQEGSSPTGIYCANDITAVGVLKYLNKHRKRYITPSVISSDGIELAQYTKPMLTTVGLPKEEMGKFAVLLLLDRIRGGHKEIVRVELNGKLMLRNSCVAIGESVWNDYVV